jgi:uncharacterized RDD family membrane protein YckC
VLPDEPSPASLDQLLALDRRSRALARIRPSAPAEPVADGDRGDTEPVAGWGDRPPEVHLRCAPAWRRAAAWAVDAALLLAAAAPPIAVAARALPPGAHPIEALVPQAAALLGLLAFAYSALAHSLTGTTAGKRLLGLRVAGPDGGIPGPGRSAARALLAVLGVAALGVGLLAALFTRSGRGLHDAVADTVVVCAP